MTFFDRLLGFFMVSHDLYYFTTTFRVFDYFHKRILSTTFFIICRGLAMP